MWRGRLGFALTRDAAACGLQRSRHVHHRCAGGALCRGRLLARSGIAVCFALTVVCLGALVSTCRAQTLEGVVVRFDEEFRPTVSLIQESTFRLPPGEVGLVVWADNGSERWQVFRGTWRRPDIRPPEPVWLVVTTRSAGGSDASSADNMAQLTTQLDPLISPSVIKALRASNATGFLTPPDGGVVLGTQLTLRRTRDGTSPLLAGMAVLTGGGTSFRIPLGDNQSVVRLQDIAGVPAAWKTGLPPGRYSLQFESQPAATFDVEGAARREQVTSWLTRWRQLSQGRSRALEALVAAEYLASREPQPYLADVLDIFDALEAQDLTPYLQQRWQSIAALLQTGHEPAPSHTLDESGIEAIDEARRLIARGRWNDALARLQVAADLPEPRGRALADLYRGVIHAESGLGQEQAADFYFRRAIAGLAKGSAADRLRAHNNYANFLLNRTQDRLFNHAFQMAAGVRRLFVTAIASWEEARIHYEAAFELADQLGPAERAAVHVNQARLYATLGDVLATLDAPAERQLTAAEQAANQRAAEFASAAIAEVPPEDRFVRSVAETIQAHLAFRARDAIRCRQHAESAIAGYTDSGSLAGIESMERLLGLITLRTPEFAGHSADQQTRQAALAHLERSQLLAELLREQLPADRVGLTRAGFFARRIHVHERLVELLIAEGKVVDALRHVELAKARALQDLLTTEGQITVAGLDRSTDLDEILRRWPAGVVALEYFLTSERAWLFVVSGGKVRVYPLIDETGQPLAARELVGQVRSVLREDMDRYATKMQKRLLDGLGFDHSWQDRLHALSRRLLPAPVMADIRQAQTLLVVPHHILHYFPFVAIVTQPDPTKRGALEMIRPRFLIDEACDVCYAPSLTVWDNLRQRPDRPITEAAAIGIAQLPGVQPLPGVTQELASLRTALAQRLRIVVTDEDADIASALALLKQPGFLLVGTHGQNWPDQPLSSELFLFPRGSDSGRLTAAQLYLSQVGRDLIVLSACYTALADKSPLPGDDLFGLQRALLQSGGRTVIAGQWDIYDRSGPELMHYLFAHLARGKPAHQALALAQRQLLARLRASSEPEPWLHPYFWAAFTISGDDRVHFASAGAASAPLSR
jgi:CHAT domain-containing protein